VRSKNARAVPAASNISPKTSEVAGCSSNRIDSSTEDCRVAPDRQSFCVRAERAGKDPAGRRYAVSIVASDDCGNQSAAAVIGSIDVPHDQSQSESCIRPDKALEASVTSASTASVSPSSGSSDHHIGGARHSGSFARHR
jgi:hypothetical protein